MYILRRGRYFNVLNPLKKELEHTLGHTYKFISTEVTLRTVFNIVLIK